MLRARKLDSPPRALGSFNGHPPLGVNATIIQQDLCIALNEFQWAPTLGGECYLDRVLLRTMCTASFNGHPPLGVNATSKTLSSMFRYQVGFNGHPPLGVNATSDMWG